MKRMILITLLLFYTCTDVVFNFTGEWKSAEKTFGPYAREVILKIYDSELDVFVDGEFAGTGTYYFDNSEIILDCVVDMHGVEVQLLDITIISDNSLFIRWKHELMYYPVTSFFTRL